MKKIENGFTLLELLVVVLIIAILAAIALPQYKYAVAKAKFSQLLILSKAIKEAQTRYILLNGTRNSDLSTLDIDMQGGTFSNALAVNDKITFDWGHCRIGAGAAFDLLFLCALTKLDVGYFTYFYSDKKACCASKKSGAIGERLCQAEFPDSTPQTIDGWCGTDGKLYKNY